MRSRSQQGWGRCQCSVDDDAVVGVSVHGQGVNLGVSLGVGIVGARGKRRCFSPRSAARQPESPRIYTIFTIFPRLDFSEPFLPLLFSPFLRSDISSF